MSDHFEPKLYVAFARAGGKAYETQRLMYDLLVSGYKLEPMNVKKENNMNDIEFTNLHVKNILNGVIGAKPPKQPVMSKPIQHMVVQEPEIVLKSSWDDDEVNGVMATFRKDIYAKVIDTMDKAIVDAVIDFAKSEGFTDVYLIDKTFIVDAFNNKFERAELRSEVNELTTQNGVLIDVKAKLERDLEDKDDLINELEFQLDGAEERNNVKDALIRKLAAENEELRATLDEYKDCIGDDPRVAKDYCMKLGKKCDELRVEVKRRVDQIGRQAESISQKRDEIDEMRKKNKRQEEELDSAYVECERLRQKIIGLEHSIKRYEILRQAVEAFYVEFKKLELYL